MAVSKKNPLAAEISRIGDDGTPNLFIGSVNFKVVDRDSGWIAGVLRDAAGQSLGRVQIFGFPLGEILNAQKGPGRPTAGEKHLAVFLAWALKFGELGGKRKAGAADDEIAKRFAFLAKGGEPNRKTVRDIRVKQAKTFGLDLDRGIGHFVDQSSPGEGPPACSILIEKPTIYETPGGGLEILGASAIAWAEEMGAHVARLAAVRLFIEEFEPGGALAAWKAQGGPKIISIIRPGR